MEHTLLCANDFALRRSAFFAQMPNKSIAFFAANAEKTRSNDTEYAFCQDKNFYYLTGFNEPDALLVMLKDDSEQSILFSLPKDPLQEVWHGRRIGQEAAKKDYQLTSCFTLEQVDEFIPSYLDGLNEIWYIANADTNIETKLSQWIAVVKAQTRAGKSYPTTRKDCSETLAQMRLLKSEAELSIMRRANYISGLAHQRAMRTTQENVFEYQIEADLLHEFSYRGARHAAYSSIVAGGDNGNILHYTANDQKLKNGDLLLIDAGCELAGYAADITRTFPVNGKFTEEQSAIYQLVLNAQNTVIEMIKPSMTFAELNAKACEILTTGLYELGILSGDLANLIADNACKKYFIHGLGHWLGLDVHDVGDYQSNEQREQLCPFAPGMVMTIEPGLYIPADDQQVDSKWRGIAVRIEDNIVVTEDGYENITVNSPKEIDEIEALMALGSKV